MSTPVSTISLEHRFNSNFCLRWRQKKTCLKIFFHHFHPHTFLSCLCMGRLLYIHSRLSRHLTMIPIQATCASINSVIILIVSIIYTVMMMIIRKKGSIIRTSSSTRGITFACMKPSFRLSLIKMHWNTVNGCRNCILQPPIKIIKAG